MKTASANRKQCHPRACPEDPWSHWFNAHLAMRPFHAVSRGARHADENRLTPRGLGPRDKPEDETWGRSRCALSLFEHNAGCAR
jgi:hypothetical protein